MSERAIHPRLRKFAIADLTDLGIYRRMGIYPTDFPDSLVDHHVYRLCEISSRIPEEVAAQLHEVGRHDHPQIGPQEYECGCVAIACVTSRDGRDRPFEMRLAIECDLTRCYVPNRWPYGAADHHEKGCSLHGETLPRMCDCLASDASDADWGTST